MSIIIEFCHNKFKKLCDKKHNPQDILTNLNFYCNKEASRQQLASLLQYGILPCRLHTSPDLFFFKHHCIIPLFHQLF